MSHMSHSPAQGPTLAVVPGENPSPLCQVQCGWHCHPVTLGAALNTRETPTLQCQESCSSPPPCSTAPLCLSKPFLHPTNVLGLLALLPWLTGRGAGSGLLGFPIEKTSPSLDGVRHHPSRVAQGSLSPTGDPSPCPAAFPL